jgi:4'-phosphopantetheinyl transferase
VAWAAPTASPALVHLLDDVERARLERFRNAGDRERFVAAHALLRIMVGRRLGCAPERVTLTFTCPRCGGPHGPPRLVDRDRRQTLHLSLAHAGARVLVAVSAAGPVGVDVDEEAATAFSGFDAVALGAVERSTIARLPPSRRALARVTAWVRKEAVLKATGDGLNVPPGDVVVSALGEPPRLLDWDGAPADPVHLQDIDVAADGYSACVAVVSALEPAFLVGGGEALLIGRRSRADQGVPASAATSRASSSLDLGPAHSRRPSRAERSRRR